MLYRCHSPAQTVGECSGSSGVTLAVERRAISPGTQWPEGGGRARQVQADVPEGVYGGGDATGEGGVKRDRRSFIVSTLTVDAGGQSSSQTGGGSREEILARHHQAPTSGTTIRHHHHGPPSWPTHCGETGIEAHWTER